MVSVFKAGSISAATSSFCLSEANDEKTAHTRTEKETAALILRRLGIGNSDFLELLGLFDGI